MILLPLILTTFNQLPTTDTGSRVPFRCATVDKLTSVKVDPKAPFADEVVLVSGFGGQNSPELDKLIATVVHGSIGNLPNQSASQPKYLLRSDDDQKLMREGELSAISAAFKRHLQRLNDYAAQHQEALGSGALSLSMAKEYANYWELFKQNPQATRPWFQSLGVTPVNLFNYQLTEKMLAKKDLKLGFYEDQDYSPDPVGNMALLPINVSSDITTLNQKTIEFNGFFASHGRSVAATKVPSQPKPYTIYVSDLKVPELTDPFVFSTDVTQSEFASNSTFYRDNKLWAGGTAYGLMLANKPAFSIGSATENKHLVLSPTSELYRGFLTYKNNPTSAWKVNGKPFYEPMGSDKSQYAPSFYEPASRDPLSYYVADLIVQASNALGYDKVVGDLPDSLLTSFKTLLDDAKKPTVSQVLKVLQDTGLELKPKGDTLLLVPVMPEAVESIRSSRAPYQIAFQLVHNQGFLTFRQYAVFCSKIFTDYNKRTDSISKTLFEPVDSQEAEKNIAGILSGNVPEFCLLGTLTDSEWDQLPGKITVSSLETADREKWWKIFYSHGERVSPFYKPKNGEVIPGRGSALTLSNRPSVVFYNIPAGGSQLTFVAEAKPLFIESATFKAPLKKPPFNCSLFQFGALSFPGNDGVNASFWRTTSDRELQVPTLSPQRTKSSPPSIITFNFSLF